MNVINMKIKELRESLNLSQEDFGKSIGLSKSGVSNIENGNRNVRDSYIELICAKYNISKDWLLYGNDLAKDVFELENFLNFLKSNGYVCDVYVSNILESSIKDGNIVNDNEECEVSVIKDGITSVFTEQEFKNFQKEVIKSIEYLLWQQNNKK